MKREDVRLDIGHCKKTLVAVILLLLVTEINAVISPPPSAPQTSCQFGYYRSGIGCRPDVFINASTITLFIISLFLAVMYMIAKSVESPRLINWTESELYQTIGTAAILMFYLTSISVLDNIVAPAFSTTSLAYPGQLRTGGNFATMKDMAIAYVDGLFNQVSDAIRYLAFSSLGIGVLGTLTVGISVSGQQAFVPLQPGYSALMSVLSTVLSLLVPFAMQLKLQVEILKNWDGFFAVLLPLGILLRSFPFTRSAGGAMIAIAIGFTIFLPIIYLLVQDIAKNYLDVTGCSSINIRDISFGSLDLGFTSSFQAVEQIIGRLFNTGPGGVMGCILFKLVVEASILPFFGFLIVLNIIRYTAEIFGANVDFSTLVRLI